MGGPTTLAKVPTPAVPAGATNASPDGADTAAAPGAAPATYSADADPVMNQLMAQANSDFANATGGASWKDLPKTDPNKPDGLGAVAVALFTQGTTAAKNQLLYGDTAGRPAQKQQPSTFQVSSTNVPVIP